MRSTRPGPGWASRTWPLAALLSVLLLAPAAPAGAQVGLLETTIDMNYTYEQEHLDKSVTAGTGFQQKYQVKLSTNLTSSLDFLGAVTLDLDNKWDTDAATTEKVAPSLELGVRGPQSAARFSYTGTANKTREFEEQGETTAYSNGYNLDLEMTPDYWPELKFKLQEKRDYQRQSTEATDRIIELQVRDDYLDDSLRLEFMLMKDTAVDELPTSGVSDGIEWSLKGTYKQLLLSDVEFEVAYELKETSTEDTANDAFVSISEGYTQTLKSRIKKSLELTPRLTGALAWEYSFDQDLLQLEYDYKLENKYSLELRYDVLPGLKVSGDAKRETTDEQAVPGEDDASKVVDTLKAAFDFEPVTWMRLGGKAERKREEAIKAATGGSIDGKEDRQYELTLRNKIGDYWELAASTTASWSYVDGQMDERESKLRAGLRLTLFKLTWVEILVQPTYEATRKTTWDDLGLLDTESSTGDGKIRFEFRALLLDKLKTAFYHEYGQKITRENDAALDYTEELGYTEDTRLTVSLVNFLEDFTLEGQVERKADDTENDDLEKVVTVSYQLNLDWKYEGFSFSSAFKYNDKSAEEFDDLEFTAKLGWKGERVDVMGDYQFLKTYADTVDEDRKLNLKLSLRF